MVNISFHSVVIAAILLLYLPPKSHGLGTIGTSRTLESVFKDVILRSRYFATSKTYLLLSTQSAVPIPHFSKNFNAIQGHVRLNI